MPPDASDFPGGIPALGRDFPVIVVSVIQFIFIMYSDDSTSMIEDQDSTITCPTPLYFIVFLQDSGFI